MRINSTQNEDHSIIRNINPVKLLPELTTNCIHRIFPQPLLSQSITLLLQLCPLLTLHLQAFSERFVEIRAQNLGNRILFSRVSRTPTFPNTYNLSFRIHS